MKTRYLYPISLFMFFVLLASCGGGGGGGSSSGGSNKSLVEITVDNNWQTASLKIEKATLYAHAKRFLNGLIRPDAATAAIPSSVYKIAFTISASDMPAVTKEVIVAGQASVTETFLVENGSNRVFLAEGKDSGGTVLYRGSTTATLDGSALTIDIFMLSVASDTTAPTIMATSPANGGLNIPLTSTITATFSETMDSSTLNTTTFTVNNGTADIAGAVTYAGNTATFTPAANLTGATTYTATITTGAKDLAGNAIASAYSWSFTSEPSGTLDTTFNGTGYIRHNGAGGINANEKGYAITLDSSGRILVAGYGQSAGFNEEMVIWRYNSNGTLDTTFNGTGYVSHNSAAGGNGVDRGYAITTDSSGRILVAGSSQTAIGDGNMALWRYNANGTLDTTFNGTGYTNHDGGSGVFNSNELGNGIIVDSSGKIIVVGASTNAASYYDMVIWKYNADGTLDTTFNGTGYVRHNGAAGGNVDDSGQAVAIDSSGKIVVGGYSGNATPNLDMAIWRFNANGTLDTTFNGTGYVSRNGAAGGNGHDFGYAITIDSSGRILITGWGPNASGNDDMVILRYNSDGTLDTTFNGTGYVSHNSAAGGLNSADRGYAIKTDSAGKILVAGKSSNGTNDDIVTWRYNSNGTLDTAFNGTGFVVQNGPGGFNSTDTGYGIAIDSTGKVLVTGESNNAVPQSDLVIMRYR